MIFRRLELGLFVRFILLLGMMYVTLQYLTQYTWLQVTTGILIMLAQLWEIARYVTRSNNELAKFLEAVKHRDFSQRFKENTNSSLQQLHKAFNLINGTFRQLHNEREAQFQYMQTILQLVDTGILALNKETGEAEWVNDAFKKMLGVPHLKSINRLQYRYPGLYNTLQTIDSGKSELIKLKLPSGTSKLLVSGTDFTIQHRHLLLVVVKNVSTTIDATETEAWQKLLRVMTHEIMNSVAPIASLADTLGKHLHTERERYSSEPETRVDMEVLGDTQEGLGIIKKRSQGLLQFTQFYRDLNKKHHLNPTTVYVHELLESINALMRPRLQEEGINFICKTTDPDLTITGDVNLLEQVLINLLTNAQHAVRGKPDPLITLIAKNNNGKPTIEVHDNGTGIPEELLDNIFIPFFTSHKEGSGIGLSLSKHIMHLHKGNIQVESEEGTGSIFMLVF